VDAHAQLDPLLGWHPRIALRHSTLLLDRAAHGVHHAAELDQNSVAGAFDNAATVFRDLGFQKLTAVSVEAGKRAFLVGAHEPAVAGDITSDDRS